MTFEIRKQNGKMAIFEDGVRITKWFDRIWYNKFIKGESDYLLVRDEDKCIMAIYGYIDRKAKKITKNFEEIWT